MGKTFISQTSFASGEVSPSLYGRIDREIYFNGAAALRNVVVTPLGGVKRRMGSERIVNTQGNVKARLVSFQFSIDTKYLLSFTPQRINIYKNDALVATVTAAPITDLTADIIAEMNFVQSLNTLILVHKNLRPIRLVRTNDTTWTPSYVPLVDIPTFDFGAITPSGTMTASAVSGNAITITASVATFTAGMVGWAIRGNGGYAFITAFGSATSVTARVVDPFNNISAFSDWVLEEPQWSATRGWPISATFWNNRLWFGGARSRPQTVWGSKIAGFFDFNFGTAQSADAIEWTADDDEVNSISNIFGGRTLQVFSQSSEYFSPLQLDRTVTPATFKLERATRHGSNNARPVSSDGATIFVELSGRVVREFLFLDVEQSYIADDISFLSEHLIRSPVTIALQKSTETAAGEYTYFVNADGTIAVLNRRRAQNFIAWTLWETDGQYEDAVVVGNDLYATVKRSINGSDVRFIEKFVSNLYTDAGIILNQSPATNIFTGLTYLEGKIVNVRSGLGYPLLSRTVLSGQISIESNQEEIEVGLPFTPRIRSLPPESVGRPLLSGERRRIVSANFNIKDSFGFEVTNGITNVRVTLTAFGDIILNQVTGLFNGWKRIAMRGYKREPYIEITQSAPSDLHILSMKLEVTT
jgi:hypothetical protein